VSLGRCKAAAGSASLGRLALAAALVLCWLAGAPVGSWALLDAGQTSELVAVPAPGSPLALGTDTSPDSTEQVLPPLAVTLFSGGEGLPRWAGENGSLPYRHRGMLAALPSVRQQVPGSREGGLAATLRIAPRISLTSSHTTGRTADPSNESYGLTATRTAHALLLNLGSRATLKAGLNQQREEWDRRLGKPSGRTEERALEFTTAFGSEGSSSLRLAMTAMELAKERERKETRAAEAHLNLVPAARFNISADYVTKDSGSGEAVTTESLRTAFRLAPEAELSASVKTSGAGEGRAAESGLALSAKLGCGKLRGKETWASTSEGRIASRKWAFAGGFGRGPARTNIALDLQESRGERPEDQLARKTFVHVDRALGRHLKLTAESREDITGRNASPEGQLETECGLEAAVAPGTSLAAALVAGRDATGASLNRRRLRVRQQWKAVRLELEQRLWQEGAGERPLLRWSLDAPTGELPKWAQTISAAHQFADAKEYLMGEEPARARVGMPFVGYRLWAARREGGDDDGSYSLGFAHRRVIAGRLHLQLAAEERPEADDGPMKGRPLEVRRRLVEIGGRLFRSLNARCSYALESGLDSPGEGLKRAGFGIWGRLADGEEVEGGVWHESGRWEGERRSRTSLTLLYSHRVDEEHRLLVKMGYAWGEEAESERDRDCRLTLGYEKPL